jgi:hypothetical protein
MTPEELKRRGWGSTVGTVEGEPDTWSYENLSMSHISCDDAGSIEHMTDARLMEFWDWAMTEVANGRHAGHEDPVEAFYASKRRMTQEELKRRGWWELPEFPGEWWHGDGVGPHPEDCAEELEHIVDARLRELLAWVYGVEHNGPIRAVVENTLKDFYASMEKKK